VQPALTDRGVEVADQAMDVVRALNGELTSPLGGPDSAETRALGAALQTVLREAPEPGATRERGDD